jgi:hypothetical protein
MSSSTPQSPLPSLLGYCGLPPHVLENCHRLWTTQRLANRLLTNPTNRRSETRQTPHNVVVATVNVKDIVNFGDSRGCETSYHQGRAGTNIWGYHRCTLQMFNTANNGVVAIDSDVSSKFA